MPSYKSSEIKKGKTFLIKVFPFFIFVPKLSAESLFPVAVLRIGHGNCSVNHMRKFRIGQKGK